MISQRAKNIGIKELEIFDHFQIDHNLPKHITNKSTNKKTSVFDSEDSKIISPNNFDSCNFTRIQKIKNWVIRILENKEKSTNTVKTISIVDFFTNLSKSYKELTPIGKIATYYEKALVQANALGQIALFQKLKDNIEIIRGESHLITMKLKRYVTEEQIINFYDKVGEDKNLKLTWIKNFNRIIPEEIYLIKKDVDERKIFDNYLILHYDPDNNGEKLTKKEIEKKKDPILFGVIKNSKKLYYIADWKDDYCELTLDEMFNTLGKKVLQINNKNVKTFIDKI